MKPEKPDFKKILWIVVLTILLCAVVAYFLPGCKKLDQDKTNWKQKYYDANQMISDCEKSRESEYEKFKTRTEKFKSIISGKNKEISKKNKTIKYQIKTILKKDAEIEDLILRIIGAEKAYDEKADQYDKYKDEAEKELNEKLENWVKEKTKFKEEISALKKELSEAKENYGILEVKYKKLDSRAIIFGPGFAFVWDQNRKLLNPFFGFGINFTIDSRKILKAIK